MSYIVLANDRRACLNPAKPQHLFRVFASRRRRRGNPVFLAPQAALFLLDRHAAKAARDDADWVFALYWIASSPEAHRKDDGCCSSVNAFMALMRHSERRLS